MYTIYCIAFFPWVYIAVSSAYITTLLPTDVNYSCIKLTINGPRMEPCGTPMVQTFRVIIYVYQDYLYALLLHKYIH